jgi:hypothetical protein
MEHNGTDSIKSFTFSFLPILGVSNGIEHHNHNIIVKNGSFRMKIKSIIKNSNE